MKGKMSDSQIREYFRRWGYLQADVDPLKIRLTPLPVPELDQLLEGAASHWRSVYCGPIGAEFMHILDGDEREWIADYLENPNVSFDKERFYQKVLAAEGLEQFLHTRYIGAKRFSLEGSTSLIALLDIILNYAADSGFEMVMLAMPHRGRLNVLYNTIGVEPKSFFAGFEDIDPRRELGGGDVKYHKGATGRHTAPSGRELQLRIASNPSHLEAVNSVLMGRVRAHQFRSGDIGKWKTVLPIIMHGDASFAGQGTVPEALNLMNLPGYCIGGTIHIIVNNLIGFTASPESLHSSRFASDAAKPLAIPILHVNGETPEAIAHAGLFSLDYRNRFNRDVVIDLIGYRRYGHSEIDDPTITHPVLYQTVHQQPPFYQKLAQSLGKTSDEVEREVKDLYQKLDNYREEGKRLERRPSLHELPGYWSGYCGGYYDPDLEVKTSLAPDRAYQLAQAIFNVPDSFNIHPKIEKLLEQRKQMTEGELPLDWGMAETFAYASLLWEGIPVRLAGEDSARGTFAHRHAVLYDQTTGERWIPLQHLARYQGPFEIYDSPLSELAALGFEYGFSRDYPEALTIWEAQFGDFVNGAQMMIDQFIAAGEDKWSLLSGLVMLLPHGYEGQGPEHSSGRIERFLQLAAKDNIQICQPSSAGQFFHTLRRQVLRRWRKPLVVFTPKGMLRMAASYTPFHELMSEDFRPILDDEALYRKATRLLVCSGKIAHELRAERRKRKTTDTAIVTIEQLYPFPERDLATLLSSYVYVQHIVWVQAEPANMGPLTFVRPILERLANEKTVTAVRRSENASPATGSAKAHDMEQEALMHLAFTELRWSDG
jgi:2-oxoglutarate dehydrogenase E1 component